MTLVLFLMNFMGEKYIFLTPKYFGLTQIIFAGPEDYITLHSFFTFFNLEKSSQYSI